jgi:hypothetical protein
VYVLVLWPLYKDCHFSHIRMMTPPGPVRDPVCSIAVTALVHFDRKQRKYVKLATFFLLLRF